MPFDPNRYAIGLRRENERERERIRELAQRARMEARRLASEMGEADAGVRAVHLFGSLATGEPRNLNFDIDLALDGGDVFSAQEVAESSSYEVDVVSLERLRPELRTLILETGEVIYRRG